MNLERALLLFLTFVNVFKGNVLESSDMSIVSTVTAAAASAGPSYLQQAGQNADTGAQDFDLAKKFAQSNNPEASEYEQKAEDAGNDAAGRAAINLGTDIASKFGKSGSGFTNGCDAAAASLRKEASTETGGQKEVHVKEANDLEAFKNDPAHYAQDTTGATLAQAGGTIGMDNTLGQLSSPVSVGTPAANPGGPVQDASPLDDIDRITQALQNKLPTA